VVKLNGHSISPSTFYRVSNSGNDLTVSLANGTCTIGDTDSGDIQIESSSGNKVNAEFENMVFTSTKNSDGKSYAVPMQAVEYIGRENSDGTVTFKNCTFDQTFFKLISNDKTGTSAVDIVFENCTFNMIGDQSPFRSERIFPDRSQLKTAPSTLLQMEISVPSVPKVRSLTVLSGF
jgi:hypothetical protein